MKDESLNVFWFLDRDKSGTVYLPWSWGTDVKTLGNLVGIVSR